MERAIAVHLCPRNATTWRHRPRLPSKACKLTAALAAKDYSAAGQAASALHAMAILLVHQTKALKQVHEGSTDPGLMQEQRTATDLALRATKVTAQSLGKSMSNIVVPSSLSQESGPPRIPARPQVVQEVDESAMTWATRRCWTLLFLRRRREQRRSFPRRRAGRRILCFFVSVLSKGQRFPLSQRKSNFLRVLRSMGRQCATPCFLTLIHDPSCKQPRECGSSTCSRRALTTAYVPRRMVTPSRDDPADLELIRGSSGEPVCFPRVLPPPAVFFPDRGRTRSRSC